MSDDILNLFWDDRPQKKNASKFFTYEERGWSVILHRNAEFEEWLHKQKMSSSAMRTYPAHVADFHGWVQDAYDHQAPRNLYRDHVLGYRDYLSSCKVKPQTVNHRLSALKKYNVYLIAQKYQRNEVFKRGDFLKITPRKPRALGISEGQISRFLGKVRKDNNPRDTALVTLVVHTGMKLQEALNLRISDIDWTHSEVTVHAGDKKKARTIPLSDQAVDALQAYRKIRSTRYPKALSYFFAGQGQWKLNPSTVNRLFQKHSATITPKTLRQWFQVDRLNDGATVAEVVHLTGADGQTVSGLVKRSAEDMRRKFKVRQF